MDSVYYVMLSMGEHKSTVATPKMPFNTNHHNNNNKQTKNLFETFATTQSKCFYSFIEK